MAVIAGMTKESIAASVPKNNQLLPGAASGASGVDWKSAPNQSAAEAKRLGIDKPVVKKKPAAPAPTSKPPEQPRLGDLLELQFPEKFAHPYAFVMMFGPYTRQRALENKLLDHDLTITLPIPTNLGESFGAGYNNVAMGPFMGPILGGVSATISDIQGGTDWRKAITDRIAGGLKTMQNDQNYSYLKVAASEIARGGGEALQTGVNMLAGMVPNPNLAVSFQGVGLRTFAFSWRLAPQTVKESQTMVKIVANLKRRMLPAKDNFALRYPDYCDLYLMPDPINQLIQFKTCVLSDMKLNYAPSGIPSFFAGTQLPTEVEIALTFREIEAFTRDDFAFDQTVKS